MQIKQRTIIFFSGAVWVAVGIFLMNLGLKFLTSAITTKSEYFSMLSILKIGRENGVVLLIAIALVIGYFKGKFVLGRSAMREVKRVQALKNPTTFKNFYSKRYYVILGCMIFLGMSMRHLPISLDTRGFIDVAIGAALINGSRFYFKNLLKPKNKSHAQ